MKDFKVLLIDDDVLSLKSMAGAFRLHGLDVDVYSDPELAWHSFKKNFYPVVMTDIMMRPIDGFTVLKRIKNLHPCTRVILFSGFFTDEKKDEALSLGADKVYSKPVPIHEILTELKNFTEIGEKHVK